MTADTTVNPTGYVRFSLAILVTLVVMVAWVAAGHGFPGGSVWRRLTGQEGPTGGLTTAVHTLLRGHFMRAYARHHAAPWILAFVIAQLGWRAVVIWRRPDPSRVWVVDLVASITVFACAIYVPWLVR